MLHIKHYNDTIIIENDIEKVIIDKLIHPLNNLPPTVNKITIRKSINVYKRQNKIPYNCKLIIENIKINNINVFDNMKEEDYLDITELYLINNELTSIPESISSLVNLRKLFLFTNKITSIPESIGSLINLQILDLYDNKITSIPESISSLVNLQQLYLHNNQITSIPDSISSLVNLQILHLHNNKITSISDSIKDKLHYKLHWGLFLKK